MDVTRGRLTLLWGSFVVLWCATVVVLVGPINYLACSSENLELAEGSAKARYCEGIRDFLSSGEPSEWTTPVPYLLPVGVLAAVVAFGVWSRSRRVLTRAAVVAVAAVFLHVILLVLLPG